MTAISPNKSHPAPLLRLRGISKAFADHVVLDGIDLDIHQGEVIAILGPSGSGKTTFLRCINALEYPQSGTLSFADGTLDIDFSRKISKADILALRRKSGMVFQSYNLFPHKTAIENVIEGPISVQKCDKRAAREHGLALLDKVGLGNQADLYPFQLSGGQQQRVGIARALAIKPQLMLFDEPTSALDPELVQGLLETLKALALEGWTMIVVTHEIQFARDVAGHVVLMDGGHIIEQGTPEKVFSDAEHPRTQAFLQSITRPLG